MRNTQSSTCQPIGNRDWLDTCHSCAFWISLPMPARMKIACAAAQTDASRATVLI